MGTRNYGDEFNRDAVQQTRVLGYPVRNVSRRLGVNSHSLSRWPRLFAEPAPKVSGTDLESRVPTAEAEAFSGHPEARHPKKG